LVECVERNAALAVFAAAIRPQHGRVERTARIRNALSEESEMKRLFILTLVLAVTVAAAGCQRTWGWWRGGMCDPCSGDVYSSGYVPSGPPATHILPGPEVTPLPGR
jgi:hypothetical protein